MLQLVEGYKCQIHVINYLVTEPLESLLMKANLIGGQVNGGPGLVSMTVRNIFKMLKLMLHLLPDRFLFYLLIY